jgi:hypothetical protein
MKNVYVLRCFLGIAIPCGAFVPWLATCGLNHVLFGHELLSTRTGAFFGADVVVIVRRPAWFGCEWRASASGFPLPQRLSPLLAVLTVGMSLGLPLFLYQREAVSLSSLASGCTCICRPPPPHFSAAGIHSTF